MLQFLTGFLGLTWQEKNELEKLRVEIKKYREFEHTHDKKDHENSFEESDEDEAVSFSLHLKHIIFLGKQ